jgi:hypothetical protein
MTRPVEELASIRQEVARTSHWLVTPSPETLSRCRDVLESAVSRLTALRGQLSPDHPDAPELLTIARALHRSAASTGRLLNTAWQYQEGWARILRTSAEGYTAGGEPAPFCQPARVSIRG